MISFDDFCVCIKTSNYFPCSVNLISGGVIDLIKNYDVGEFNLVSQKMDEGSIVFFTKRLTTVA